MRNTPSLVYVRVLNTPMIREKCTNIWIDKNRFLIVPTKVSKLKITNLRRFYKLNKLYLNQKRFSIYSEADVRKIFCPEMFCTSGGVLWKMSLKKDFSAGAFLWILRNFYGTPFFYRTTRVTASIHFRLIFQFHTP